MGNGSGGHGPPENRKVAIYTRVSTVMQVDKFSLPMQRQELSDYSQLILGIEDCEVFEDAGYSGKNTDRPAYQAMMARIRKREFSHLLVWKIDRISRNLIDFATMYEELKTLGVVFVSKNEQFDTSTAVGSAMLKIILVFAELERNMTAERISATMNSRAEQGKWNGGRILFGYNYDGQTKTFSINEDEAALVKMVFSDFNAGASLRMIARSLNKSGSLSRDGHPWSYQSVERLIFNPAYSGTYVYRRTERAGEKRIRTPEGKWIKSADTFPPIVSEDVQQKAIETLSARREALLSLRTGGNNIFRGFCYCSLCGSALGSVSYGVSAKDGLTRYALRCNGYASNKCECVNKMRSNRLGDFLVNLIANIMRVQRSFRPDMTSDEVTRMVLCGSSFSDIASIAPGGLEELMRVLSVCSEKGESAGTFTCRPPAVKRTAAEENELRSELERQKRALARLQDLYLYSDNPMGGREFIDSRDKIVSSIGQLERRLDELDEKDSEDDEDFVNAASYFILARRLLDKPYINFRALCVEVSVETVRSLFLATLSRVECSWAKVDSVTFRNGVTLKFLRAP